MNTPATMRQPPKFGTQRRAESLRIDAAAALTAAFPTHSLPTAPSRFAIARARNGASSNPLYRLACWLEEARAQGLDSSCADVLIVWLESRRDAVWCGERLCFVTESRAEQPMDGDEDTLQMRAILEPAARPLYRERLVPYVAQLRRMMRAV